MQSNAKWIPREQVCELVSAYLAFDISELWSCFQEITMRCQSLRFWACVERICMEICYYSYQLSSWNSLLLLIFSFFSYMRMASEILKLLLFHYYPNVQCEFPGLAFLQMLFHGSVFPHVFLYTCMDFSCVSYVRFVTFATEDLTYYKGSPVHWLGSLIVCTLQSSERQCSWIEFYFGKELVCTLRMLTPCLWTAYCITAVVLSSKCVALGSTCWTGGYGGSSRVYQSWSSLGIVVWLKMVGNHSELGLWETVLCWWLYQSPCCNCDLYMESCFSRMWLWL